MPTYAEEFSRKVTKQAIARTSLALGFKEAQTEVINSLADIVRHYIEKLSSMSLEIAEGHGRAQPGIQDVIKALECTQSDQTRDWTELAQFAFPDVSTQSTTIVGDDGQDGHTEQEDEKDTVGSSSSSSSGGHAVGKGKGPNKGENKAAWRQPFPHLIPKYPVKPNYKIDSARLLNEEGNSAHTRPAFVPSHLPPYPPAHTYKKDTTKKTDGETRGSKRSSNSSSLPSGNAKKLKS